MTDATPTPSLRLRVVLAALGLLAMLLAVLGVTIDQVVGSQARRDQHDRLLAAADRGSALATAGVSPAAVVSELQGGGIRVRLITAPATSTAAW